jgi:hypothetical protein
MISCERAAELISLSLEAPLGWRRRLALWSHLCVCAMCRRFRLQAWLLQQAGRVADDRAPADVTLTEAARERIKAALRDAGEAGTGG